MAAIDEVQRSDVGASTSSLRSNERSLHPLMQRTAKRRGLG